MIRLLIVSAILMLPLDTQAEPIFKASNGEVTVTLYDEPCALKEQVTNLPRRVTWEQDGKVNEGCWTVTQQGIVAAYFDDKTVAAIPASVFDKVTGA